LVHNCGDKAGLPTEISTSYVERGNLSVRTGCKRANHVAAYGYYGGRRIAVRCIFAQVRYGERLDNLAVIDARAEDGRDRRTVRCQSVRRNFRAAKHALTQVAHKLLRADAVAFASVISNDRLGWRRHGDEGILVADIEAVALCNAPLPG
jgi:hypothetical protein